MSGIDEVKPVANRKPMIVALAITWTVILISVYQQYGATIREFFPETPLEVVADKTFTNERVVLDGHAYKHCIFRNATLEYNGGKFEFTNNTMWGIIIKTNNRDIDNAVSFLAKLDALKIPMFDKETRKRVEPGVTFKNASPPPNNDMEQR